MYSHTTGRPYDPVDFARLGAVQAWAAYDGVLTWGMGQTLAILDDGCDLSAPAWRARLPWGPKVVATWDSIDGEEDPSPGPLGYHGTSVGYPSSLNDAGVLGVAYNNFVAYVRCVSVVHLREDETASLDAGLRWVLTQRMGLNITAVNLAALDDREHESPMPTAIDGTLRRLRQLGVWVSAPCGNNGYTRGVSWPACAAGCFAIGAVKPGEDAVYLDRSARTDLLVPAQATSSSNAYAAAAAMILREAIARRGYPWHGEGATLPEAMMAIFQRTGAAVRDEATGLTFRRLDLRAAVAAVLGE